MNFRIVEGEDILDSIGDEFLRLYADQSVKVDEICKRLNISKTQFQNLRMRLVRRGVISSKRNKLGGRKKSRKYNKKQPKNYFWSRQNKNFHIKYKEKYYGCFKNEEDAKRYVELMRECGWDRSRMAELKERVLSE